MGTAFKEAVAYDAFNNRSNVTDRWSGGQDGGVWELWESPAATSTTISSTKLGVYRDALNQTAPYGRITLPKGSTPHLIRYNKANAMVWSEALAYVQVRNNVGTVGPALRVSENSPNGYVYAALKGTRGAPVEGGSGVSVTDTPPLLVIGKVVNGIDTIIASTQVTAANLIIDPATGGWKAWIRFSVQRDINGTRLVAKVWQSSETTSASVTVAIPADANVIGGAGIYAKGENLANVEFRVHAFYVYDQNFGQQQAGPITQNTFDIYSAGHWGRTNSGHLWEGHLGSTYRDLAAVSTTEFVGVDVPPNRAYVSLLQGNLTRSGVIGPTFVNASITTTLGQETSTTGGTYRVLNRAAWSTSGVTGYAATLTAGGTTCLIQVRNSTGSAWITLATGNLGFTFDPTVATKVRIEVITLLTNGNVVARAKVWTGATEPSTWLVSATDTTTKIVNGQAGLEFTSPSGAGIKPFITTFSYADVAAETYRERSGTTGTPLYYEAQLSSLTILPTAMTVTDTTVQATVRWSYDRNKNATAVFEFQYLDSLDTNWITFQSAVTYDYSVTDVVSATATLSNITYNTQGMIRVRVNDPDGVVNTSVGTTYIYGLFGTTDKRVYVAYNSIQGRNDLSSQAQTITPVLEYFGDSNNTANFQVEYRPTGTSTWIVDPQLMTVTRNVQYMTAPNVVGRLPTWKHQASKTLTGLNSQTTYEVRINIKDDVDGQSFYTTQVTITTAGQSVVPKALSARVTATSATLTATYDGDNNNNSTAAFQYRTVNERTWTTVNSLDVVTDRANKRFVVLVGSLKASTSYEARTVFSDPNGVESDYSNTVTKTFTTLGVQAEDERRTKHYLYKFYDRDNQYLGTIREQPEPNFAIQENSGVADLTISLPRTLSQVELDPKIDFGNRVDVWAVAYSSRGMGMNLVLDDEFTKGAWRIVETAVQGVQITIADKAGPDDSSALYIVKSTSTPSTTNPPLSFSNPIDLGPAYQPIPFLFAAMAKAVGGQLGMYVRSYDESFNILDTSAIPSGVAVPTDLGDIVANSLVGVDVAAATTNSETTLAYSALTTGTEWQRLEFNYTPPLGTRYIRIFFAASNNLVGNYWADKVEMRPLEMLVYRGRVEGYTARADDVGQKVDIEVLGLAATATDDYIRFLQYASVQPDRDLTGSNRGLNRLPTNPGQMMKDVIDIARQQNPYCELYYTDDSIELPDNVVEYTFRDQSVRACMDKVRSLCPAEWHYKIDPDGLVHLRSPESVKTHKLRLNVEILSYENNRTIQGLKNVIYLKGRQDEDMSEADGYGSVNYVATDTQSIETYGRRTLILRDANIKDPATAALVAEARLDELGKPEQQVQLFVPDEKDLQYASGSLRGYNIEEFQVGDYVTIYDPLSDARTTYWDEMIWNQDFWNDTGERVLPESVPIRSISYAGNHVVLELSERPPSAAGDFARLMRWQQIQNANSADDDSF